MDETADRRPSGGHGAHSGSLRAEQGTNRRALAKLGKIAEQAERFLKAVAAEVAIDQKPGQWLAMDFANGSVSYDAVFQGHATPIQALTFNRHLEVLFDYDPASEGANGMVRDSTLVEFAKLGTLIDPDETIGLGIYSGDSAEPVMRQLNHQRADQVRQAITAPLPTYGALQGIIHALQKEVRQPNFILRELATNALVRCFYTAARCISPPRSIENARSSSPPTGKASCNPSSGWAKWACASSAAVKRRASPNNIDKERCGSRPCRQRTRLRPLPPAACGPCRSQRKRPNSRGNSA